MELIPTLYTVALLITTLLAGILIGITWQRRDQPGARPFIVLMVLIALWTASYVAEIRAETFVTRLTWFNLRQVGVDFYPIAWLLVAWEYQRQQRLTRRSWRAIALLCVVPFISTLLVWTSDRHQLLRVGVETVTYRGVELIVVDHGGWFAVSVVYNNLIQVAVVYLLLRAALQTAHSHRRQARLFLAGFLIQMTAVLFQIADFNPIAPLGIITLSFAPTMLVMAWGLVVLRLFDLSPVVRERLVEAMSSGLLVFDRRGRLADHNALAERILKTAAPRLPAQLVGLPLADALLPWPDWLAAARGGGEWKVEIACEASGRLCAFEVHSVALQDRSGALAGTLMLLDDISERRAAQQRAVELALERRHVEILHQFIQSATHDFRTPITVLKTDLYLLKRMVDSLKLHTDKIAADDIRIEAEALLVKIQRQIHSSSEATERIRTIFEDMLDIVRLDAIDASNTQQRNLLGAMMDVVGEYGAKMAAQQLELRVETAEAITPAAVYDGYFQRALRELLDNAMQYTPAGGSVTVRTAAENGRVVVEVADTGVGIAPEDLPRIFEPLYRVDRARSMHTGGAGLGLALARRIAEKHGGDLQVSSVVGQGSTFRLLFPVE